MSLLWREVYRKLIHIILSLLLFLPFFLPLPKPLNIYNYYSLGLLAAALINSFVVKRSKLSLELDTLRRELHRFADSLGDKARMPLTILEEAINDFHKFVEKQLALLERDYEKREGYVGLLYGMIGATISLLFDPCHTFYGIVALAVIDAVASLSSLSIWRKGKTAGGELIALTLYTILLLFLGMPLLQSLILSTISTITEYFSPEDNLTVPVITTVSAMMLGFPSRCPL